MAVFQKFFQLWTKPRKMPCLYLDYAVLPHCVRNKIAYLLLMSVAERLKIIFQNSVSRLFAEGTDAAADMLAFHRTAGFIKSQFIHK